MSEATPVDNGLTDEQADALETLGHIAIGSRSHVIGRQRANELLSYMAELERQRTEARAALTAAEKRAQEADSDCEKALKERDEAVEMCDKLAARIADMDDLDIGEHSSGNCPWQNALDGISQEPT